jgi:hypothetical protein
MDEITEICLGCRARITLDMPDAWITPDGDTVNSLGLAEEADAMREFLHGFPCPRCGHGNMRITLPKLI